MANVAYVTNVAKKISADLAAALGISEPPDAWRAFYAQVANETSYGDPSTRGVRDNNPLNLTDAGGTIQWSGQTGRDAPFAVFGSLDQGVSAEVANYLSPAYVGVLAAYRSGDTGALVNAIEQSPWDAGHYGGALENFLPAAPTVAPDGEAGGATPTSSSDCPPGWSKNTFGVCVPFGPDAGGPIGGRTGPADTAAKAAGDAVNQALGGVGQAIGEATKNLMSGVQHFAVAAVVIGTVAALSYAGVRRALS